MKPSGGTKIVHNMYRPAQLFESGHPYFVMDTWQCHDVFYFLILSNDSYFHASFNIVQPFIHASFPTFQLNGQRFDQGKSKAFSKPRESFVSENLRSSNFRPFSNYLIAYRIRFCQFYLICELRMYFTFWWRNY